MKYFQICGKQNAVKFHAGVTYYVNMFYIYELDSVIQTEQNSVQFSESNNKQLRVFTRNLYYAALIFVN